MTRLTHKLLCLLAAFVLLAPTLSHAQFIFEKLSTAREKIVFPKLSDSDKQRVAEQARILLRDIYVHRFAKQDFYSGLADPVPAIQRVIDNLDHLSVAEMEEAIYRIFASQRDLHLNYVFPSPYANYQSFIPLTFTRTAGFRNFFEVRVDAVNQALFAEFAPDQRVPEIGDLVVTYNGLPIRAAVKHQMATSQGANRFGGFSRAIGQMTLIPHLIHPVPEKDNVSITFLASRGKSKKGKHSGEHYTITLPWVTRTEPPSPEPTALSSPTKVTPPPGKLKPEDLFSLEDLFQKAFNEFRQANNLMPVSTYPDNPSNESILKWGLIENKYGRFGYLKLQSFVPQQPVEFVIEEIRRLTYEEFSDTDGLIFDVRNNPGGNVQLSNDLSQLFTPGEASVTPVRLLNTDVNREIFNTPPINTILPQFTEAINKVQGTGTVYSGLANFSDPALANTLGQAYYKPVAVLMNARSYSASDFFICAMQDSGAGFVFGEDPKSGAGGADVIEHGAFAALIPNVLSPLPGDHRMRVSFRQAVRQGQNKGQLIEDFGCTADVHVSQIKSDLINGGKTQIRNITHTLSWLSKLPRYRASVRAPSNDFSSTRHKEQTSYPLEVANTPRVNIFINHRLFKTIYGYATGRKTIPFEFPVMPAGKTNSLFVEGINRHGKRLWNLKRQFTFLEEKVVLGDAGLRIDFATASEIKPLTLINRNPVQDGWNIVTPYLQIGFNPDYANNVNSEALLSLDLTDRTTVQLSFDLEFDTEPEWDFIRVYVNDALGNTTLLLSASGTQPLTTYNFDISNFAGKDNVQLHFQFTSDTNTVASGVKLQKLSLNSSP